MASSATLYTAKMCPYAQRACIAAALTDMNCRMVEVDLFAKPAILLKLNPKGQVPVLSWQGSIVTESEHVMLA